MYEKLCSYENLFLAFKKARKSKTQKPYVIKFERELNNNLLRLREELISQTYKPKPLKNFIIRDPKTRKISKSRYRDRVIHHALINIIGESFERQFIHDSFANQIGKGTLNAIEKFNYFKRKVSKNFTKKCYVLKADIKHYFEEVNHEILLNILKRKIKDEKVIWLINQILSNSINGFSKNVKKGMPLGNLTSQFFANVYLNELDQYVKHILNVRYYIRYVDDFVILHESKEQLEKWKDNINAFLIEKLKIEIHPQKSRVLDLSNGVCFLGFRIFQKHILLKKNNINKFDKKLKELRILYKERQITREKVVECLEGWLEYAKHANTFKYRKSIIKGFNKNFPIISGKQFTYTKKYKNFYRKIHYNQLEFSVQKTLFLLKRGLSIAEVAVRRDVKEGTIWSHIENLIEHGQLSIWKIMPSRKIIRIMFKIKNSLEELKPIKARLPKFVSYNEIACVRAHLRMKERIISKLKTN
jgi:retron-type reverse transcriptase